MEKFKLGDRVVALDDAFAPTGTPGAIVKVDDSEIPYKVRFDGYDYPLWVSPHRIGPAAEGKPKSKPKSELKVGDKVRIKSREWYEKDACSCADSLLVSFTPFMSKFCGQVLTIERIRLHAGLPVYYLREAPGWGFADYMFDPDEEAPESTSGSIAQQLKCLAKSKKINITVPLIKQHQLLTNIKTD